jgi:hypothetical protein
MRHFAGKCIRTAIILFIFLFSGHTPLCADSVPDARVKPGALIEVPFPDLPETLAKQPSKMLISIPQDYDAKKKVPLCLWLNGSEGPPGIDRRGTGDNRFVVVSFPLYKIDVAKNNTGAELILDQNDMTKTWPIYKVMLAEVEKIVPNIHPELRYAGGYSNGAHCISMLINHTKEFTDYFRDFDLLEGGVFLDNFKELKGRSMQIIYGDQSQQKSQLIRLADKAKSSGVTVDLIKVENTGHELKGDYTGKMHDWVYGAFLYRGLAENAKAMEDLANAGKFVDSLRYYNKVIDAADESRTELAMAKKVFEKLSAAGDDATAKLLAGKPSKANIKQWKQFVQDWIPCACIDKVKAACNEFGEGELADVVKQQGQMKTKSLAGFLDDWTGYAVYDKAVAALDTDAAKELEKASGTTPDSAKVKALKKVMDAYARTPSADKAGKLIDEIADAELKKILDEKSASAKKMKLQKFAKDYAGLAAGKRGKNVLKAVWEGEAAELLARIKQATDPAAKRQFLKEFVKTYAGTRAAIEADAILKQ